jgi:hypothetical protein
MNKKYMSTIKTTLIASLLAASLFSVSAQNLDNIGVKKGVKLSGGVNLNNVFYTTNGEQRRDPYNVILSGNLNVNLFGYDMPFSFSWSNSRRSYTQPFNRLSFTPQYKWVKAYLGYTSMTFSPYTMSGHSFLGAGAELSPGNWRFAVMAGRLNKAVEYNAIDHPNQDPAYRRMGYAVKAGYEQGSNAISVTLFTAKDDDTSIRPVFPEGSSIQPQSNVAASISGRTMLFSVLSLDAEYSLSMLNTDIRAGVVTSDSTGHTTDRPGLFSQTSNTQTYSAIQTGIGYNAKIWSVQLRYERVAPGYQTLGAYYFNNDMENYTIAPNIRFFDGKLTIAANFGLQRNNLDREREATTQRFAGSGSLNYTSGERLNLSASYSNFSSYTRNRPSPDPFTTNPMDSLDFYQISNSMNGMVSYALGDREKVRNLTFNAAYQTMNNTSNREGGGEMSDFISANAGYTHGFANDLTLTVAANTNINNASQMKSVYWGPSLSANKTFLQKTLRTGINTAYNQSHLNGKNDAPILITGLNASWSPAGKDGKNPHHSVNFNTSLIQRFKSDTRPAQRELTATLTYGYRF